MRILTSDEVRKVERDAISRSGQSVLVLMQRAGAAVARFCLSQFTFDSVCVVCGKGNNGGDGFVAAMMLAEAVEDVSVLVLAAGINDLSPDAAAMCSRLKFDPIWISRESDFETPEVLDALEADLILDAIVGTGFKPPLRGLARAAVDAINDASGIVVSVDLPSGIDADLSSSLRIAGQDAVFPHGVVTFIAPKPAHVFGDLTAGPIAVSDLDVQSALPSYSTALQVISGLEAGIAFPPRSRDAHKGQFGHILIIAGSVGKAGAAGLAGTAALRAGAGLVTVASPRSVQPTVASFAPELMTEVLPETDEGTVAMAAAEKIDTLLKGKDVVVLGPGLSRNPETADFVRRFVARCPLPLVLDADGLNAFEGHYHELQPQKTTPFRVLTPHPGEAVRLTGRPIHELESDRVAVAQRIAKETGSCVVLKGSRTVVAGASGETWVNMSGNPALAKGGSGDVLSGIIAAALGRKTMHHPSTDKKAAERNSAQVSPFLKDIGVAAAVYLHGVAADSARNQLHENSVLATDVIRHLGHAFEDCETQTEQLLFYLQK